MKSKAQIIEKLQAENESLNRKLSEAENVIESIKRGEVDALLLSEKKDGKEQVYSLTSTETPYRLIIEQMNEGVTTASADGTILYCNPCFSEIVNKHVAEIVGTNYKNFIAERDREKFYRIFNTRNSAGVIEEFLFDLNGGEKKIIRLTITYPLTEFMGEVFILATDITEQVNRADEIVRKNSELQLSQTATMNMMEDAIEAKNKLQEINKKLNELIDKRKEETKILQDSEEKYRMLIEQSNDAIYLLVGNKFKMINPRFTELFGYDESEVNRDDFDFRKLIHPKSINLIEERMKMTNLGEEIPKIYEFTAVDKDGYEIECEVNTTQIQYKGTNATQGIIRDITEKKKVHEELIRAKEEAERSNKLKTNFLAQVSHEIRTPVNVIFNYTSLIHDLIEDKISHDLEEYFDGINSASKRLIRTIDLILNMSELTAGTYKPTYEPVDLRILFEEIDREYKSLITSKGLVYRLQSSSPSPVVSADKYSLHQIFINLIDNAVKYTNKGMIEVVIGNNNNHPQVYVKDTGIGISNEIIGDIFEPFMQEDEGYSRKYEGNGLGLTLVKNYCKLNKAEISVQSEKNKGTTFIVTFNNNDSGLQSKNLFNF